jgi:Flp pilus assembly protein TadG
MEFTMCLPLLVTVVYGTWAIAGLAQAKLRIAAVAHAVTREAAAGLVNTYGLQVLANGYARADGAETAGTRGNKRWDAGIEVDGAFVDLPTGVLPWSSIVFSDFISDSRVGVQVTVRTRVAAPPALRAFWPDGIVMECTNYCTYDSHPEPYFPVALGIGKMLACPWGG